VGDKHPQRSQAAPHVQDTDDPTHLLGFATGRAQQEAANSSTARVTPATHGHLMRVTIQLPTKMKPGLGKERHEAQQV
jgi:hypothetical protein